MAVSAVFPLIMMVIVPLCVPALMAAKASLRVVYDPEVVAEVAVRLICAKPLRLNMIRETRARDLRMVVILFISMVGWCVICMNMRR